ncbi:MAG: 50S ribosomal protein L6 [Candidatus Kerfeldbacteria bacterium]
MSRVGKKPVPIPAGVTVTIDSGRCTVKGPKGELSIALHRNVVVNVTDSAVNVNVANTDEKRDRALWGLYRMLISNCIDGVQRGFSKQLEVKGVGYRASVEGKDLVLNLGFSHPIRFPIPGGIAVTVEKNIITVQGIDKQHVGEIAAMIRQLRKPEPYKGKGIRYVGEYVRQKAGKVVKTAGAK